MLQPPPALSFDRVRELRAEATAKKPVAIVILGAGSEPFAPEYGVSSLQYPSLERLRYGLWLAGQTGAPVAFSGGTGHGQEGTTVGGARRRQDRRRRIRPADPLGREANRSDTRENAALTMALLKPAGINHVVLVTHGYHMPRALRAFTEAAGPGVQVEAGADGAGARTSRRRRSNGCRARPAFATCASCCASSSAAPPAPEPTPGAAMGWRGSLALDYRLRDGRTQVHDRHDGPLRVLRALHPEGGVCHSVLVHPPGGVVGGDELAIEITLDEGAHALVTTPGATRFYRSAGALGDASRCASPPPAQSRLEWLPLETIAYSGCVATNALALRARAGRRDDRLGRHRARPARVRPPVRRRPLHAEHRAARTLARARHASPRPTVALLDSPLGWAGRRVLATMWFAAGAAIARGAQRGPARRRAFGRARARARGDDGRDLAAGRA